MNSLKRCPISYESITGGFYSEGGLRLLSRRLTGLHNLPFTSDDLRREARDRADKMSIQGVQPKLSAVLRVAKERFDIVSSRGNFILKPQITDYPHVPENEDVTMRMASLAGIEVPLHGMIFALDGSLCYFIKRFDRLPRGRKRRVEDFAQLLGYNRDTKYDSSVEQIISAIDEFCTFPAVEHVKLLRRLLFAFLVGNEDAHLKNYSVLTQDAMVGLTPAYDMLNTSILLSNVREESALPIAGKKSNLNREHFTDYLARDRMKLADAVIVRVIRELREAFPEMLMLLNRSFLPRDLFEAYKALMLERARRLKISS